MLDILFQAVYTLWIISKFVLPVDPRYLKFFSAFKFRAPISTTSFDMGSIDYCIFLNNIYYSLNKIIVYYIPFF